MRHSGYLAAMLAAAVGAVLAGCGQQQGEPESQGLESVDPTDQTVTFWYQHSEEREAALLGLIERFNRTNSYGIKVAGEYIGGHDEIYSKMLLHMQSGPLPQVVVAYRYQAQAYYRNGAVVDLKPYMNSPRWGLTRDERADYFQEFIEQDQVQGKQIAFLPSRSMEVLYYNVDWLRELGHEGPPRDWDAFEALCRQATEQPFSGARGTGPSMGLAVDADASRVAAMVFSRGGDLTRENGSAYTLATPEMCASLDMLQELAAVDAAVLMPGSEEIRRAFSDGRALFVMRSSSGMPLYRSDVAAGAGFTWDVAPVPYQVDLPVPNVYGASLAVCRTTPEQQLAAWLFIKWFTQPEQQDEWCRQTGYFPVRRSTAREIASYFRISYGLLELGKPEPWMIGYGAVREMIEEAMVQAMRGGDAAQILSRVQAQADRTIEE